jgi:hypothetical protein
MTIIYNCKHCKTGKRVEYPCGDRFNGFYRVDSNGKDVMAGVWIQAIGGGKPTVYGGDTEFGICSVCGHAMKYGILKAFLRPECPCDARCTNARGHNCECSCGGANHGSGR